MSTQEYPYNGVTYPIGSIGWEPFPIKVNGIFGTFMNVVRATYNNIIGIGDIIIPTYGFWAGPGWSGGDRPINSSDINWQKPPCYDKSIIVSEDNPTPNPDNCLSLLDAVCKNHDWRYDQAKKQYDSDKNKMQYEAALLLADVLLLEDVKAASNGSYTSPAGFPAGTYNEVTHEWGKKIYTGTLDDTEELYLAGLVPLFTLKIMTVDNLGLYKERTIDAVSSILAKIPIVGTIFDDPADPFKKTIVARQDGLIAIQNESKSLSDAWIVDLNIGTTFKPVHVTITYGQDSAKADKVFELPGNKVIRINGGSGSDEIKIVGANGEVKSNYTFEINGGDGIDTYYLDSEFNYKLIDSGYNRIYVEDGNGGWMDISSNFYAYDTYWLASGGSVKLSHNSPWTLTLPDGSTIELGDDFQSGDFGINLIALPTNPAMDNTITGDLSPVDFDPNTAGIQTRTDEWGNIITDPDQPDPGRADTLFDTPGNDLIISGGGDDVVHSLKGGQDRIQGGAGCDILDGDNSSSCIIEGGADSDIIFGGINGHSRLFGDTYGDMAALITDGEEAQDNGLKGDIVAVCYGDNYLYGSNGWDILWGGTGRDLIVAGAGDDLIIGDGGDITANYGDNYTWSFSITEDNDVYIPVITGLYSYDMNAPSGNADVIYAGTGNDYVVAGSDTLFGGKVFLFRRKLKHHNTWRRLEHEENLRRAA